MTLFIWTMSLSLAARSTSIYPTCSQCYIVYGRPVLNSKHQAEVRYLGHIISRRGVTPDTDNTKKVASWPVPTSVKATQQFLGIASYYRRFINISPHCQGKFVWNTESQEALRHKLSTAPVLAHPIFQWHFILDTDASNIGLGAVLSPEGKKQVIAYGSTKPERKYCVTRRKLLAVVNFTQKYRHYLLGRRFL